MFLEIPKCEPNLKHIEIQVEWLHCTCIFVWILHIILYSFIYSFVQLLFSFNDLLCTRPDTGIQKGKSFKKPLQKIVNSVVT